MLDMLKRAAKSVFPRTEREIPVRWIRKSDTSWLACQFAGTVIKPKKSPYSDKIERLALETNKLGPQPLWSGYGSNNAGGPTREPDVVRTSDLIGDFYTCLVKKRRPRIIVEFGTAFGVSGMYFLAGLEINKEGRLLTFDPNHIWAELARKNLSEISQRFNLTIGTFEENIDNCLPEGRAIDIAFIDAIHTKEIVIPQLDIVVKKSSPKALILLDDINFSESMKECWEEVSADKRFSASAALGSRVGILELK